MARVIAMNFAATQEPSARDVIRADRLVAQGERESSAVESITTWLQAGARGELRHALDRRLAADSSEAYARAVEVELSCWDPGDHRVGARLATEWLGQHDASHELYSYVQLRADWLNERLSRRDEVEARESMGSVLFLGALVLSVLLSYLGYRLARDWPLPVVLVDHSKRPSPLKD